jgi:hypothetical protein
VLWLFLVAVIQPPVADRFDELLVQAMLIEQYPTDLP